MYIVPRIGRGGGGYSLGQSEKFLSKLSRWLIRLEGLVTKTLFYTWQTFFNSFVPENQLCCRQVPGNKRPSIKLHQLQWHKNLYKKGGRGGAGMPGKGTCAFIFRKKNLDGCWNAEEGEGEREERNPKPKQHQQHQHGISSSSFGEKEKEKSWMEIKIKSPTLP